MDRNLTGHFDLERFVEAQTPVYDRVCAELRGGLKVTHWIWFIFPQISGLSSSTMSIRFAIESLEEACDYLGHPLLGPRLIQCTELVTGIEGRTLKRILGPIDSIKFQSCMTLFNHATTSIKVFQEALRKYFSGQYDQRTLDRIRSM